MLVGVTDEKPDRFPDEAVRVVACALDGPTVRTGGDASELLGLAYSHDADLTPTAAEGRVRRPARGSPWEDAPTVRTGSRCDSGTVPPL
jgi:hypothetical protein